MIDKKVLDSLPHMIEKKVDDRKIKPDLHVIKEEDQEE